MSTRDFPIWRRPRHHMDVDGAGDHVHWVELFFDLARARALFSQIGVPLAKAVRDLRVDATS